MKIKHVLFYITFCLALIGKSQDPAICCVINLYDEKGSKKISPERFNAIDDSIFIYHLGLQIRALRDTSGMWGYEHPYRFIDINRNNPELVDYEFVFGAYEVGFLGLDLIWKGKRLTIRNLIPVEGYSSYFEVNVYLNDFK